MLSNFFKTTFRNFWRHKFFTLINILGLSLGLSAALVMYLIVSFDFSFDRFHPDSTRIYRVVTTIKHSGEVYDVGAVPGPLVSSIKNELPDVALAAPFYTTECDVTVGKDHQNTTMFKNQSNIVYADHRYFAIFPYKWLAGSPTVLMNVPNVVVLSLSQAKKYFPKLSINEIIGRQVLYNDTVKTTVSGIVEDLKQNTDLTFHDFISYSTITSDGDLKKELEDWNQVDGSTQLFLKLNPTVFAAKVEKQLNQILKSHRAKPNDSDNSTNLTLQPLSDLHFNSEFRGYENPTVNKITLYSLIAIAVLLLLLGCINFINLTTAQSSQRAKEIGIRKTLGSSKGQLITYHMSETFIITLISVGIALLITPIILNLFASFIPAAISANLFHQINILWFLLGLILLISVLAGGYPAVVLSNFNPVTALKNQTHSNSGKSRNARLRKYLTVSQFIVAQFFIMTTIMVSKQLHFILQKDLGFRKDAIVYFSFPEKDQSYTKKQLLLSKIKTFHQIDAASLAIDAPSSKGKHSETVTFFGSKGKVETDLQIKYADENYLPLYHIKLLAGRNITMADSTGGVLINNTFVHILNFKNPQEAIGKSLNFGSTKKAVVGVFSDFHQASLHAPIRPLAIYPQIARFNNMYISLVTGPNADWTSAIANVKKAWIQVYPSEEFDYQFLDQTIAKFYDSEKNTSKLLSWATGISIFISCLGMLGLALYSTNLRKKEIGIRKVLGASVARVILLLSSEVAALILVSFLIATPVAWLAINSWLQNFYERTPVSWWIFFVSAAGMFIMSAICLGFQTLKAAFANPVISLKSE